VIVINPLAVAYAAGNPKIEFAAGGLRRGITIAVIACLGCGVGIVFEMPLPPGHSLGNAAIAFLVLQVITVVAALSIPIASEVIPLARARTLTNWNRLQRSHDATPSRSCR